MEEMNLSLALSESIRDDSADTLSEIFEVGIDSFLDDGVLKDFPLLSTIRGIYKVGKSVNDLYLIKKLASFIRAINAETVTEKEKNKRKATIKDDSKKRSQELEYLLILINRYIGYEKPEMLAKIYLAYIDGSISWEVLAVCAEIIDRVLPGDFELLKKGHVFTVTNNQGTENALRLVALGLAYQTNVVKPSDKPIFNVVSEETLGISYPDKSADDDIPDEYKRTRLGDLIVQILNVE